MGNRERGTPLTSRTVGSILMSRGILSHRVECISRPAGLPCFAPGRLLALADCRVGGWLRPAERNRVVSVIPPIHRGRRSSIGEHVAYWPALEASALVVGNHRPRDSGSPPQGSR